MAKRLMTAAAAAVIITIIFGTIYVSVQQTLRSGANDPQIQIAEETAAALNSGQAPASLASGNVDAAHSVAPFVIVYNHDKQVLASSAQLNGLTPQLPPGVLDNTTESRENRLTWQPQNGVRIAAVAVAYSDGYVLSGRNLREVEQREDALTLTVIIAWLFSLGTLATAVLFSRIVPARFSPAKMRK